MAATEARAPSGPMTLLRIIGGAVRGVAAKMRRVIAARATPAVTRDDPALPEDSALIGELRAFFAECQASMAAEVARKEAQARDVFPEGDDAALAVLWSALGVMMLSPKQRAALARHMNEHAIKLELLAVEFPGRRVLFWAEMKSRCLEWRRFAACLIALRCESQKCDKHPVGGVGWNCVYFVPIS